MTVLSTQQRVSYDAAATSCFTLRIMPRFRSSFKMFSLRKTPPFSVVTISIDSVIGLSHYLPNLRELEMDSFFVDQCLPCSTDMSELQASFVDLAQKITRLVVIDVAPQRLVQFLPRFLDLAQLEVRGKDDEVDALNFNGCDDFLPTLSGLLNLVKLAFITLSTAQDFWGPPLPPSPDKIPQILALHISSRLLDYSGITLISALSTLESIQLDFNTCVEISVERPHFPNLRQVVLTGPENFIVTVLPLFSECSSPNVQANLRRAYTYHEKEDKSEVLPYFIRHDRSWDAVQAASLGLLPPVTALHDWVPKHTLSKFDKLRAQSLVSDALFWDCSAPYNGHHSKGFEGTLLAVQEARDYLDNVVGRLVATRDTVAASQLLAQLEGLRAFKRLEQE